MCWLVLVLPQMHHSSEYYNLGNGLRQSATEDLGISAFDLLQVFFMPPNIFMAHRYLNFMFQFWLHTELVPYLGPLEYFFNTPSSHRVHHGRNPYCIDKNYGAVLIIWDRLFGTYGRENPKETIIYGLVTPVNSYNQLWCQFFRSKYFLSSKCDMKNKDGKEIFPGVWNKIKACWLPPGYFPGMKTKRFFWWLCLEDPAEGVPEITYPVKVYNPPLSYKIKAYLVVQMIIFVIVTLTELTELRPTVSWFDFGVSVVLVIAMMQKFSFYFDQRSFAVPFDVGLTLVLVFVGYWENIWFLKLFGAGSIVAALFLRGEVILKKVEKM